MPMGTGCFGLQSPRVILHTGGVYTLGKGEGLPGRGQGDRGIGKGVLE